MRSRFSVVVSLLSSLMLFAPASPATAATSVTLEGLGYGHGRGLSQYGAYGAALQGRTASQILAYYYPGTSPGTNGSPVKVWLTKDDDGDTAVLAKSALRLMDLGTGVKAALPALGDPNASTPIKAWRLTRLSGGATRLSYLTDVWRPKKTLVGEGEFRSLDGALALRTPVGDVKYWGYLRHTVGRNDPEQAITVNVVGPDRYVRGVLPKEVFTSWPAAALQAQAVAARTYAAWHQNAYASATYHLCDTTACQVYGGLSAEVASTTKAVVATSNVIRTYSGKPAFTEFSSSSGGYTAKGAFNYLAAMPDKFDDFPQNTVRDWGKTLSGAAISAAYPTLGTFVSLKIVSRTGDGAWGGRATVLQLVGSKNGARTTVNITTLSGVDSFRRTLGLRSTWFRVV